MTGAPASAGGTTGHAGSSAGGDTRSPPSLRDSARCTQYLYHPLQRGAPDQGRYQHSPGMVPPTIQINGSPYNTDQWIPLQYRSMVPPTIQINGSPYNTDQWFPLHYIDQWFSLQFTDQWFPQQYTDQWFPYNT